MDSASLNGVITYAPESTEALIDFAMHSNSILVAVNAEKILHLSLIHIFDTKNVQQIVDSLIYVVNNKDILSNRDKISRDSISEYDIIGKCREFNKLYMNIIE